MTFKQLGCLLQAAVARAERTALTGLPLLTIYCKSCSGSSCRIYACPPPCADITHFTKLSFVLQYRKHRLLEEDGLCSPGQIVSPGDTYINKETPINTRDTQAGPSGAGQAYKPSPMTWKGVEGELVVVDKVMIANNDEGSTVLKVWL